MPETVTLDVNGRSVQVPAGSSVSSAVAAAGIVSCRESVSGEPRAPLCGMGICFECRVTVDGQPHARGCQMPSRDEMKVVTGTPRPLADASVRQIAHSTDATHHYDVVVVGAGPAGLAAATAAAESGARVAIVDDNQSGGGQIWRRDAHAETSAEAAQWLRRVERANIEFLGGMRLFDAPAAGRIVAESAASLNQISYRALVIAAGARERFLPFPGWSLPNVCGAGGLQALVKAGLNIEGKRVVIAGTGPLLLAVADYLKKKGARISVLAEQVPTARLLRFGLGMISSPSKAKQAVGMLTRLASLPMRHGWWVTRAGGEGKLEEVTLSDGNRQERFPCDYLAIGFHLVPNIEVASLLECETEHGAVIVDDFQQTSVANVFSAGEATGIGGLDLSLVEGLIAGYAAAGKKDRAHGHFSKRTKAKRFANLLNRTFRLREELRTLPETETIVCRCEDVRWGQLQTHSSWRSAKLHTRCGMGPCQGRVCGPAVSFLLGWEFDSVRPPVFPVRIDSLVQPVE